MAVAISTNVLQKPDGTNFRDNGDSNPCPVYLIGTDYIQEVTASTAVTGAVSKILVNFYKDNQVQTGDYYVGTSVTDLLTAINA